MEIYDTIEMMCSADYKERFRAEYYQLKIRTEKLKSMLEKLDKGELKFTPTCSRETLTLQYLTMSDYLLLLEVRARIEHISL